MQPHLVLGLQKLIDTTGHGFSTFLIKAKTLFSAKCIVQGECSGHFNLGNFNRVPG